MRPLGTTALIVSAGALLLAPSSAAGEIFTGILQSLDATQGQLEIQLAQSRGIQRFPVSDSVPVLLDGEQVDLSDLNPGVRLAVVTNASGQIQRLIARAPSPNKLSRPDRRDDRRTRPDAALARIESRRAKASTGATVRGGVLIGEWPQFRGPNRDNVSPEDGLTDDWSTVPPRPYWMAEELGEGYSSVALVDGTVFTMGTSGSREVVFALDADDGRQQWVTPTGGSVYKDGRGNGPRGTPTVDGDKLYALGADGDLICLEVDTGRAIWRKNVLRQFQARNITWGISESVLIDDDRLICTPGGAGAVMVALDKNTGEPIWRAAAPDDPRAAYASAIVAEVDGVRQYINFVSDGVLGVRADDGKFLWHDSTSANGTANCSTPIFYQNHVFSASGYGTGGSLLRLETASDETNAELVYRTKDMKSHHGGMLLLDGYLYGSSDPGVLTCLDLKTGEVAWRNRSVGKGSITYAQGHIYLRSEDGPLALVEATPKGYREKGRIDQPHRSDKPAWAHPVVADGKLFLRDMDRLLCYDVRAP